MGGFVNQLVQKFWPYSISTNFLVLANCKLYFKHIGKLLMQPRIIIKFLQYIMLLIMMMMVLMMMMMMMMMMMVMMMMKVIISTYISLSLLSFSLL